MTEWGKALRPSVHDLIKQTNALDAKVDDIETLPIVDIDYDTESVEISATINKTYEELRTYAQGCIVHDSYFNDVTLGTVTVDDDFVQLVYGFSGIVSEAVTYNTITVTVNADNTNEVVIGTDSFSGGSDSNIYKFTYSYGSITNISFTYDDIFNVFNSLYIGKSKQIFFYDTNSRYLYTLSGISYDYNIGNDALQVNMMSSIVSNSDTTKKYTVTMKFTIEKDNNIPYNSVKNITSEAPYTLPTASATQLGGVKVGSGLSIDSAGVLSATTPLIIFNETTYNASTDMYTPLPCQYTPQQLWNEFNNGRYIIFVFYQNNATLGKSYAFTGKWDKLEQYSQGQYRAWIRTSNDITYMSLENDGSWFID